MAASLERSLALLRRERLDLLLLLHEAEPADLPAAGRTVLAGAQADGIASAIGFAHFGPARTNDSALTAQVAPWPEDFSAGAAVGVPRIFHSIRNGGRFAAARDPAWAARQAALAERIVGVTREGDAGFLAALLTLAESWPQAGLIFTTTDRARLGGFLRALDAIERAGLCNAVA